MSTPARTGTGGRAGRPRATQVTASASTSRSILNFTWSRPSRPSRTPNPSVSDRRPPQLSTTPARPPAFSRLALSTPVRGAIGSSRGIVVVIGGVDVGENRCPRRSAGVRRCAQTGGQGVDNSRRRWMPRGASPAAATPTTRDAPVRPGCPPFVHRGCGQRTAVGLQGAVPVGRLDHGPLFTELSTGGGEPARLWRTPPDACGKACGQPRQPWGCRYVDWCLIRLVSSVTWL